MQDKSFAHDLLGMYIVELEDYLQQLPDIISQKDVAAYRFLNHKVRSLINTLEAFFLLDAQTHLLHQLNKNENTQDIAASQQQLEKQTRELIQILTDKQKYYAELNNQVA